MPRGLPGPQYNSRPVLFAAHGCLFDRQVQILERRGYSMVRLKRRTRKAADHTQNKYLSHLGNFPSQWNFLRLMGCDTSHWFLRWALLEWGHRKSIRAGAYLAKNHSIHSYCSTTIAKEGGILKKNIQLPCEPGQYSRKSRPHLKTLNRQPICMRGTIWSTTMPR